MKLLGVDADAEFRIEHINVSKAQQGETAYLGRARMAQPRRIALKHFLEVHRHRRRRRRIKVVPKSNKRQSNANDRKRLPWTIAMWSIWSCQKKIRKVNKLTVKCRMQGVRRRSARRDLPSRATARKTSLYSNRIYFETQLSF